MLNITNLNTFLSSTSNTPLFSLSTSIINKFSNNQIFLKKYSSDLIKRFRNPKNVGKLDTKSDKVGSGIVGAPACGDVMKIDMQFDDQDRVEDVKIQVFGCGAAIASSSLASEYVKGKTIEECKKLKNTDIANELALPPVKLHCSLLAEEAVKKAIENYEQKKAKKSQLKN